MITVHVKEKEYLKHGKGSTIKMSLNLESLSLVLYCIESCKYSDMEYTACDQNGS